MSILTMVGIIVVLLAGPVIVGLLCALGIEELMKQGRIS